MNLILTSALFLRQHSFDFLFLMQCQNLHEKTSAVDQLDTPSVTTKWHRPGGRDNDGAPTGTNAASTHGAGLEDAVVLATLHSVYGNQSAIASCGTKQMQQRPCME